jgi:hypothetical protein
MSINLRTSSDLLPLSRGTDTNTNGSKAKLVSMPSASNTAKAMAPENMAFKSFRQNPSFYTGLSKNMLQSGAISTGVFLASLPACRQLAKKITDNNLIIDQGSVAGASFIQTAVKMAQHHQFRHPQKSMLTSTRELVRPENLKNTSKGFLYEGARTSFFHAPYFLFLKKATEFVEKGNTNLTYLEHLANGAVLGFGSGVAASPFQYPFTVFNDWKVIDFQTKANKTTLKILKEIVIKDTVNLAREPSFKGIIAKLARCRVRYGIYGAVLGLASSVMDNLPPEPPTSSTDKTKDNEGL